VLVDVVVTEVRFSLYPLLERVWVTHKLPSEEGLGGGLVFSSYVCANSSRLSYGGATGLSGYIISSSSLGIRSTPSMRDVVSESAAEGPVVQKEIRSAAVDEKSAERSSKSSAKSRSGMGEVVVSGMRSSSSVVKEVLFANKSRGGKVTVSEVGIKPDLGPGFLITLRLGGDLGLAGNWNFTGETFLPLRVTVTVDLGG